MKEIEVSDKIYVLESMLFATNPEITLPKNNKIEYIHKDVFIKKVQEFLWKYTPGTDYHVNYIVKKFEKYMEE